MIVFKLNKYPNIVALHGELLFPHVPLACSTIVWRPFPLNLDMMDNIGGVDSPSPVVVVMGGRPADPSPGSVGDDGLLGGQGVVLKPATPSPGTSPKISGWTSSGSVPKVAALLPLAFAFLVFLAHSSIE